ncbi:glutamate-rich protein 3 isoform X2 [Castor canadensis]|uniref:Glutamate-rich protein 3 isoform X2 n=1 Tax=Castor canadensis TaxID=51338 RepID=A0AC58N2G7_CASCN
MSHSHPAGLLAAYNSLTDKHLAGYFNNTRIRRHLLRSGLITRSGRILSEKEYKLNIMKRDHQKYIRECLAQAIFHKVLDMERYHQLEIKRKLETLARKERIQRFKGEDTRRFLDSNMPVLSPHPPVGPKTSRGHTVLFDEGKSSPLTLTTPRPYTAPGHMQPPIRLEPLPSNHTLRTGPKITSGSRSKTSLMENEVPFPIGGKKAMMKFRNSMGNSQKTNLYQFPNIDSYVIPMIPSPPPPKVTKENRSETWKRRRVRPITAPNGLEPLFTGDSGRIHKTSLHSNAAITMIYLGKNVHLSYEDTDFRDEIIVYQQHCGGENLCVYKGKLLEKETFQFVSKRHHGFPFSLTFFLNGMQVNRLSSCCEYKHRNGSRLGGKRGYFGFVCVEKSSPCYKCIIAMGLDKKITSTKYRKEKSAEKREEQRRGEERRWKERENMISKRSEIEGKKTSVSDIFSAQEIQPGIREVRTAVEEIEQKGKLEQDVWEDNQEKTFKYEYEEDFEADEEKQDKEANEEGQGDDQINGISKSPTEDEKDIKSASSASSRSHPYSSDSEDESAEGDSGAHTENSTDESVRSSSSQELSENDEPGKSHLSIEHSFEVEIEDQEITKVKMETKHLSAEKSYENDLEKEMENETQGIVENLSEKSRKHASEEEKEKDKSKLWEESTAKVKDKGAGFPGVEESVGQIISEALVPGCYCHSDTESVSSTDEGEKPTKMPETDTGRVPSRNLVMEEREAVKSNKASQQVSQERYTLEKKEAVGEDEAPQPEDAGTVEEKRDTALQEKAGLTEDSLAEQIFTAEQPALAEQCKEQRELPLGTASRAETEAEGDGRSSTEELNAAKVGARDSVGLSEDEVPKEQALMQVVLETEKAASKGTWGWKKSVLINNSALSSELFPEARSLRQPVTPEMREMERGEAESETGSKKPDVDEIKEDMGSVEDAGSERENGSEEAKPEEELAQKRKKVLETERPLSSSAGEAEACQIEAPKGSPEELCEKAEARQELVLGKESHREGDRKEMLPEELNVERRKAERTNTPLWETGSEREEVTWANACKDEDTLEEQKLKGEDGEPVKEIRLEEETKTPQNETVSDAEDAEPIETTELTEDKGLLEDLLEERMVAMSEATSECEKSLEQVAPMREEGGERLNEASDTEHKGRTELLGQENVTPLEQGIEPPHDEEGASRASGNESAGKAQEPEVTITATGEDEECAAKDWSLARLERDEGPLKGQEGMRVMIMTQEDIPKGNPMMAGKVGEEAVDKEPEKDRDTECTLGTRVRKDSNTEGDKVIGGVAVETEEDLHQGGVAEAVAEQREVLADSKTADRKTVANKASSFSDVAGEKTWHQEKKALGKTAAVERVVAEETALSSKEVPVVEEVTVTSAAETGVGALPEADDLKGQAPELGQDQEGEVVEATQHAGSVGKEAETGSPHKKHEPGGAEEFRQGSSPKSELNRESLEAVAACPAKPDFSGIQEKQEHMVQGESENADISLND